MPSLVGRTVSHYQVLELVGRGGMGAVYRARDLQLDRDVALKFLAPDQAWTDSESGTAARDRFLREARAASALDHPNISTIYGIDRSDEGEVFIAMAFYEGETLASRIAAGGLSVGEALPILRQIAAGLAAAHAAGIVHRDIKPANVLLTRSGSAKIIDFGLARMDQATQAASGAGLTGTVAYMAPEQVTGAAVVAATDVWALGATAFEMLTGTRPFGGENVAAIVHNIVNSAPGEVLDARDDIPQAVKGVVKQALSKRPADRFANASAFLAALPGSEPPAAAAPRRGSRTGWAVAIAAAVVALAAASGWWWKRTADRAWVRAEALPEIARLADQESYAAAAALLDRARAILPGDPALTELAPRVEARATIVTVPEAARVFVREYGDPNAPWRDLGRGPIDGVALPLGMKRWRIEKEGFVPLERAGRPGTLRFELGKTGTVPEGMVGVPPGRATAWIAGMDPIAGTALPAFFIDRHEVTNRQFRQFIDAGGYRNPALWKTPVVRDGRAMPWEEAVAGFVDATGRPGPSTWELGTFPAGQDDHPVSGVSWYEAAAYAESVGKTLPSVLHWVYASSTAMQPSIVALSNFGGKGPAPVGQYQGMSQFGLYDTAGNVREWLANANGAERHMLGGAWNDPSYLFSFAGSRRPLDRSAGNGFRCAKYPAPPPAAALEPVPLSFRDFSKERPVSEAVHRAHLSTFEYDALPLDARTESREEDGDWRREVVTFAAAYGRERVTALVYLPKSGRPPYQTIVMFPGSNAINEREATKAAWPSYLAQSGRAVVLPVYKGTWERADGLESTWPSATHRHKEAVVRQVQDFRRTVDYLSTRSELDLSRLAYYGVSWGGRMAAIIPAVDKRVKVAVVVLGGLAAARTFPEVDQINYITRVTTPVLMINGRYDAIEPLDSAQLPMLRLWGTPAADKKHVIYETGHGPFPQNPLRKEVLDFLDKYVGAPAR